MNKITTTATVNLAMTCYKIQSLQEQHLAYFQAPDMLSAYKTI